MEEIGAHPYQFRHPSLLLDCPTNEMEFCENVAISRKQLGIKKPQNQWFWELFLLLLNLQLCGI